MIIAGPFQPRILSKILWVRTEKITPTTSKRCKSSGFQRRVLHLWWFFPTHFRQHLLNTIQKHSQMLSCQNSYCIFLLNNSCNKPVYISTESSQRDLWAAFTPVFDSYQFWFDQFLYIFAYLSFRYLQRGRFYVEPLWETHASLGNMFLHYLITLMVKHIFDV